MSDKRTEMAKLQHQAAETVHTGAGEVGKFIRWAIAALLVGGSVGTVIGLFRMAVSWAVQSRAQHPALLFAVPLAGLLIVWLYRSCGLSTDPGTDYLLLSHLRPGDVVITQDYGLAALCLARSAQALHPAGHAYTKDNIDALLTVRAESARLRRGGVRLHRTAARKPAQDHAFSVLLCRILSENTGT